MKSPVTDEGCPDDALPMSTPEAEGLDPDTLRAGLAHIEATSLNLHALLVVRNGRRVFERYGVDGERQVTPADAPTLMSTTKTVTAMLIGIAISEGLIPSVEARVLDYFSDDAIENRDPAKDRLTIEDLLTMRSGLRYAEGDPFSAPIWEAECMAAAYLSHPMIGQPGVDWNYSTGDSQVLAEILRRVSGMSPLEYARERLFDPLGIDVPEWEADPGGTHHGGTGLHLTPRNLARFGWMLAQGGRWGEAQIVPEAWIETATRTHAVATSGFTPGDGYGYQCWIPRFGGFVTRGYTGRHMFVLPEYRLLVVITGDLHPPEKADAKLDDFVARFIVGAVRGD